jgi:hypothetical protein
VDDPVVAAAAYFATRDDELTTVRDEIEARWWNADGTISWARYPGFASEAAALQQRWVEALSSYDWPAEVQGEVDAMLMAVNGLMDLYETAASVEPGVDQTSVGMRAAAAESSVAEQARAVRSGLGLPPEPTG